MFSIKKIQYYNFISKSKKHTYSDHTLKLSNKKQAIFTKQTNKQADKTEEELKKKRKGKETCTKLERFYRSLLAKIFKLSKSSNNVSFNIVSL